ncbi:helix-turn-helix domain-containing protein [Mycobacteroides chelonae]|uniref:helix-turn-helix domain-containing protein n=1 Tax=Mycobacteroides chelonae TaxID=1774 RepID=UPI00099350EF|nr:helix-turn-helix domain-containing protein [Mycobacteroides chelonae]
MTTPSYGLVEVGNAAARALRAEVVDFTVTDAVVARTLARMRYRSQVQGQSAVDAEFAERRDPITAMAMSAIDGDRYVELRDLVAELWSQIEDRAASDTFMSRDQLARMLTVSEVAEAWEVSDQVIRDLIASGELPATRIGRPWRITVADAEAFVARNRSGGDAG